MGKRRRRKVKKNSTKKREVLSGSGKEEHLINPSSQNGKTLKLTWPCGLGLIKAFVLLAIFVLFVEFLLRVPAIRRQLPPPVLGTGSLTFDVTWEYLQRTLNQYGHVDCVFVGSSMIKYSIEPKLFQKRFREESGHDIVCFNFGILGMKPSEAGFYKSLVEKFDPSLIVTELSPLILYEKFLENRNSPLISQSPWGRFQSGKFSVKGWLLTHSLLFRYFMRWNMWVRSPGQYIRLQRVSRNIKMDGFLLRDPSLKKERKRHPALNRIKTTLSGRIGNDRALNDWIEAFSGKTPVVFLEMPLRSKAGGFRGEVKERFSKARVLLRKTLEERGELLFSPGEQIQMD
ncbi:MAG: hypothetical protein KAH24_09255, partial [Holophagae bacterium]|nr:hypothetical protein [Holophagae bacterium]